MRFVYIVLTLVLMSHDLWSQGLNSSDSAATATSQQVAEFFNLIYADSSPPEGAKMMMAIAAGSRMGPGEGWFGPAETRFDFAWLAEHCQAGGAVNSIPSGKFKGPPEIFNVLDRNQDGVVDPMDLDWSDENPYVSTMYMLNRIFRRMDRAGSGELSREDWEKCFDEVSKGQTTLTAENFSRAFLAGFSGGFSPGDGPDEAMLMRGLLAGEVGSMCEGPKVGQLAPVFSLRKVDGDGVVDLSSLLGEKPLVIVLGNFTCGPFRAFYPAVDRLYEKYKDQANFLMVYVREAHPTDGWKMESNERVGVAVSQPKSFDERSAVARQFCSRLQPKMTVVVDELSDPVGHAYSGMPARMYVIDVQGRVAYKSGRGPFGFRPPEMEQALCMCLLENLQNSGNVLQMLPPTTTPVTGPVPNWVRPIATQLPRTAAAMLRLDYAHRMLSPLDPVLRAKLRYAVGQSNRCDYSMQTALADLRRAGVPDPDVTAFQSGTQETTQAEIAALSFVRQLSVDASNISDELFSRLRSDYGDRQVAAMVLLGAYGNFQDRILLGLDIELEESGPIPPLEIEFEPSTLQMAPVLPPNQPTPELISGGKNVVSDHGDWASISFQELQQRIHKQKLRTQRLPAPTWDEIASNLPPEYPKKPTRIVWNLVCMGYVPELAIPWTTTTRTMWAEAQSDRVFEESLFWVQTRAIECNYCMGHCEMLLSVAGLSEDQTESRLRCLASDDWSAFPEHEQRAFAYARKLTLRPWELTVEDFKQLETDLGKKEAMATFFWLCRGLYMTRISDGFQLQLESENVFVDFSVKPEN